MTKVIPAQNSLDSVLVFPYRKHISVCDISNTGNLAAAMMLANAVGEIRSGLLDNH